ncbi:pyridoxamine 5'-phosphate oxidase family protein [Halorientalis pallida]|uniref:Pyridoxamine 5'-phosphate oxidase family protein n=1 Tax=Halorientalis pallida TaxID=2479928 RepID=A0A498KZ70_9EURY|nr:pyridoxamine 5'-phosphate oxidase family protein [Halorientalis pallida]RXK51340.1 pyridoxamine 5'-phosphate oxidase family protein [Halorientalis pallida]
MTVDELGAYGLEQLTDDEINAFLANQRMGVLGLPTGNGPYMLPLSFGFDGESRLYFTYVLGGESRKADLSERAEHATFLAYSAESPYNWESVSLTGRLEEVPESEWDEIDGVLADAWRPGLIEEAAASADVAVYRFLVEAWSGVKHTGLPPGFD